MKKKLLAISLTILATFGVFLWEAAAVDVTFAWDYDFTVDPACSGTVTTDCIQEFRLVLPKLERREWSNVLSAATGHGRGVGKCPNGCGAGGAVSPNGDLNLAGSAGRRLCVTRRVL